MKFVVQGILDHRALSSVFLLFSASAIAGFSDPSRKGFNRGITEGQKRGGAADEQNSLNKETTKGGILEDSFPGFLLSWVPYELRSGA